MNLMSPLPAEESAAIARKSPPRILLVQYAGDYREAYQRLQESGTETYHGHRYVLDQLAQLRRTSGGEVAILCCNGPSTYNEVLPTGLRVIAAGPRRDLLGRKVQEIVSEFDPTHLVFLSPMAGLIRWATLRQRRVMCMFADSFEISALRRFLRFGRLGAALSHPRVELIANHGVNACLSLAKIGVESDKIVPWDWVHTRRPGDFLPKTWTPGGTATLTYVGTVSERKGVGDLITGVSVIRRRGTPVRLRIAGAGQIDRFKALAASLNVAGDVEFLGLVSNHEAFTLMRNSTVVMVPSQHAYPEGLPLTIYEALCTRTPIVASDHPMFRGRLLHGRSGMVYRAGDPEALADCVEMLLQDPALYANISCAAEAAWQDLQIPAKWGEILLRWLRSDIEDQRWLEAHRLREGLYEEQIARAGVEA
jgi:glycosyltransferase involved in cell wall biosynthesis